MISALRTLCRATGCTFIVFPSVSLAYCSNWGTEACGSSVGSVTILTSDTYAKGLGFRAILLAVPYGEIPSSHKGTGG